MYKVVKIGDSEVPMMAMASCDLYFKNVFGEDPLRVQSSDDSDGIDMMDFCLKIGFIMAKFAELKSRQAMKQLTEDDYIDWLDSFEREDLMDLDKMAEIIDVYQGNKKETSTPKKEDDQ